MNSIKEKILLYKIKATKDPESFALLYDAYVGPIYRFIYVKVSNKEEAEDIASDTFLKAWQYLIGEQADVANFRAFIYQIARNRVVDAYRERARKNEQGLNEADAVTAAPNFHKIDATLEGEWLYGKMKQLKQEYQEVLLLRYVEELSLREIATILGKGSTAVRVTLHRAVKKLKELTEHL